MRAKRNAEEWRRSLGARMDVQNRIATRRAESEARKAREHEQAEREAGHEAVADMWAAEAERWDNAVASIGAYSDAVLAVIEEKATRKIRTD